MILEITNIHKAFGGVKALDGCSMQVNKNQITALIGPNGSGKTTLFDTISRLQEQDEGKVVFNNKTISEFPAYKVAKAGISRTFQDPRLFKHLTIQDHIEIALHTTDESLLKSLKSQESLKEECKKILKKVGLEKPLETFGNDLSYGQRKLLDLAIALAKPHKLLMLDEPVAGVNPKLRETIKKILKKLVKEGETILLIEHDMNFVMDLAKDVFVLDQGKVIAKGTPKQIRKNPKVLEAYLGE